MKTVFDPRYDLVITTLIHFRERAQETQTSLSDKLGKPQSYIAKIEGRDRRLDIIELFDILQALSVSPKQFFRTIGWIADTSVPVPLRANAEPTETGIVLSMTTDDRLYKVILDSVQPDDYLRVEAQVSSLFAALNEPKAELKNRDTIAQAFEIAFRLLPNVNPSDVYHHIVYRLYLREYNRSKPEQSWVRAGGEGLGLFLKNHYTPKLEPFGIQAVPLYDDKNRQIAVLHEMGIYGTVGNSKLDIALYGSRNGEAVLFGGIHVKASLAERVSDDVPCSEAMIRRGFLSILFTFDAKSFPPPAGDLVNRGEFGSLEKPNDKRQYIEVHGSFDACFSYNLRTVPSPAETPAGKRIFVSRFGETDPLPRFAADFWTNFSPQK
jgi:transcriptional regulator with XRE-family HTH domain